MLTSKERAYLRSLANKESAVVIIGKDGFTDNLITQAENAIKARELIKISVLETSLLSAREAAETLCEKLSAQCVQTIGNKAVLYRRNPQKPQIELPKK